MAAATTTTMKMAKDSYRHEVPNLYLTVAFIHSFNNNNVNYYYLMDVDVAARGTAVVAQLDNERA